ncbi:MAG: RHS repeat-associated core domain-containing protein, partial [Blastocatellia bacterium]
LGNVTRYGYGIAGLLTSVTDGRGFIKKKLTYASGVARVIKQEFADGGFETYDYKLSGTVVTETKVTDSLGRIRTMRFNAAGYVIGMTDELGQSSIIRRDMTTNLDQETTGPCGCPEVKREFDNRGNLRSMTDRLSQKTEYEYDPNFTFVTQIKDALGRITRVSYDSKGNPTSMTDALGRATTYAYDGFGQLVSMTDPLGHTTRYEYDANGYVSKVIDALGNTTTFEYDTVGRLKKITDGEGRSTSTSYDNNDRIISVTDPAGVVTRYEYDENNNRTLIINAQNKRWSFVYDEKNRLTASTDPLNQITRYRYNTDDEMLAMISPPGRTTSYEFDARGQRTKIVDPLKGEIRFTYDNQKNLTTLTDQRGNTTTFTYDELYRRIAQRDPLGLTTTSAYDPVGNLIEKVDRLNRRARFDYDALNRPVTITYIDAMVSYTFDEAGRLTKINDTQSGSIEWTYDDANRMLSERTIPGLVSYTYNKANQRISMTAADRPRVSYEYDTAGRQQKIIQGAETFTWSYDDLSRMKSLQRPNGVTTTYSYDAANKLNRITHANASGVALEDLQYSHNTDNEIEAINSLASGTLLPTAKTASAADAANRIARFGQAGYTFDEEGQTRTKTDNQGTTAYDWDARGRLTKVMLPNGQVVSYVYDALGRRVIRTANGLTTTFLSDDQDIVLDRGSGGVATDYLNGPGIDNKLRQATAGAGALYFLQDHLGTTVALAGAGGGIVERQIYEAFGLGTGSSLTRYTYTSREWDAETSLYYYRARYYNHTLGRFISEDPIRANNLYAYVDNNPIKFRDPTGELLCGLGDPCSLPVIGKLLCNPKSCKTGTFNSLFGGVCACWQEPIEKMCNCICGLLFPSGYQQCIEDCKQCNGYKSVKDICKCSCDQLKDPDERRFCHNLCSLR